MSATNILNKKTWLENKIAVSKQALQTTQIMNINDITRVYAKITGGGGIPPLAAHAYAVDTRRFFLNRTMYSEPLVKFSPFLTVRVFAC